MRFDRTLIGVLLIWILAFAPSACGITISVGSNAGGFTESINADEKDAVYSSTVIAANSLSHSIEGSGSLIESHRVSNTAGANAGVGVNIRQAEWYSYSYDLWPGQGSSWPASKFAQVAASEQLDVLNAKYIQAYANAHNSKGYTAGVSTVISDPGREASLTGYSNLAMASKNEAFASQTADGAFAMDGFIQADSGADFTQLKSRPLQFRWDTADASTRVDRGSVEGYCDMASASAYGVTATQQIDAATGEQIRTRSESESWTASLFQGLKTANAKVSTRAEGEFIGYNASAGSSEGYAEADQAGHIVGSFTSTALAGKASKTRTSNYGEEYDFDMQAKKDASGSYATGTLGYYVDNVSPLANRIQGAVDASESGDAINVAPGNYYENVQIDKSLKVLGSGASKTIVDGQQSGSVFTIGKNDPNVDVSLSGMTIQGGTGTPFEIYTGFFIPYGGGIVNYGTMKLRDSTIFGNAASKGGGIYNCGISTVIGSNISGNKAYAGGGIYSTLETILNVDRGSIISENHAAYGGGIANYGLATIAKSVISKNEAYEGNGGGILNGGIANIADSEILENFGHANGGGIFNSGGGDVKSGIVTVIFSNVSRNGVYGTGGGICSYGTATVADSTISENNAYSGSGGGVLNGGTASFKNSTISRNIAYYDGGGIYNWGTATIADSNISENVAYSSGQGGGICSIGMTTIRDSTISRNLAAKGGGIYGYITVNVTGSNISENTAYYLGGGILNGGTATITDSNISKNTAAYGGGFFNEYGTATVEGGNITENIASDTGGGIFNAAILSIDNVSPSRGSSISYNTADIGAGIFNDYSGTLNLNGGSIDHNNAYSVGGGIYNDGTITGDMSLVHENIPDQIVYSVDWLPLI